MPTGDELHFMMSRFTTMYNATSALSNFITVLLWVSTSEALLWGGAFLTFCAVPSRMALIWIQILHVGRAVFGYMVALKLPKSHEVIESLPFDAEHPHTLTTLEKLIGMKIAVFASFSTLTNQMWLRLYALLTAVCFLFDLLCFVIQYRWFIESTADHTNLWMICISLAMLFYDVFPAICVYAVQNQLPSYATTWIWESLLGDSVGLSNSMQKVVGDERAEELDRAIDKLRADKEAATLRAAESKMKAKDSA